MANTNEALNKVQVFQDAYARLIDGKIGTEQFFNIAWNSAAAASAEAALQASQPIGQPVSEDIWPIVNIDVDGSGNVTNAKLYAPGLPTGNHDVYPVRVPYLDEHTEAWFACSDTIREFINDYLGRDGLNGIESAVAAIRELGNGWKKAQGQQVSGAELTDADSVDEPCSFCFVRGCNGECSGDGMIGD